MAKETGFASFTPKQSKEFIKEQEKRPKDSTLGAPTNKDKKKAINRFC